MLFVIAVTTDLNSDRSNQTRIKNLETVVAVVKQLAFMDKLGQSQRRAGFAATNHSSIKDQGWSGQRPPFIKGALHSLDKLNLAVVGLDIKGREESIVDGVVDKLWVSDDDSFISVLVVLFQSLYTKLEVEHKGGRNFYLFAAVSEAGPLIMGEDPYDFDEDINEFEDFRLIDLLVDLILPDIEGHIEESDELEFKFLELQTELNLHSFERVGLQYKLNIFLKVVLDDLQLHLLIVLGSLSLRSLFACLLILLFLYCNLLNQLQPLEFLLKLDVVYFFGGRGLFGEVLLIDAERTDHFDIEVFTENDVVFETGLYFEVLLAFLVEISEEEHAVGDFFLEESDFFFD